VNIRLLLTADYTCKVTTDLYSALSYETHL